MDFELIRIAIAIVGCLIATYFDLTNNRNIPNNLTYSFVGIAVLIGLVSFDISYFVSFILPVALVIFVVGYLLYSAGQLGGADVLILLAISILLPEFPKALFYSPQHLPFTIPYVITIFLFSGLLFTLWMFLKYVPACLHALLVGEFRPDSRTVLPSLLVVAAYFVVMLSMSYLFQPQFTFLIGFIVVAAGFFSVFKDYITDTFIIEKIPLSRIEEEDVLAIEKMNPKLVKKYKLKKLLTAKELARMKKAKIPLRKYPVYTHMPVFLPYILASLLLTLLFGDPLAMILGP